MCCIFTCCGWMVDLIQRAWVFFMSCCISSAVCCVLFISSMSGVALGYNYSLAEFVDLKETNVSVYLKRGIFDDDITDESEWRRRGGGPIKGHVRDDDLITGSPEDSDFLPERSGRRLDDSILQSDDANKFEGSLMKLTAKAPYQSTVTTHVTSDLRMGEIVSKYPPGSPDQLKAIQGLINMRKAAALRDPNVKYASTYGYDESMLLHAPGIVTRDRNDRRQFGLGPDQIPTPPNRNRERFEAARKAVPDEGMVHRGNWLNPKVLERQFGTTDEFLDRRTRPQPIPLNLGPIRPTRPATINRPTNTPEEADVAIRTIEPVRHRDNPVEMELDEFKENVLADKFKVPQRNPAEQIKTEQGGWKKSEMDYYDEDIKGLPVRKKRSFNTIKAKVATEPRGSVASFNSKRDNVKMKENTSKANKITDYLNAFLNKLLSSSKPLSNELSFYNEAEEIRNIKSSKVNDNFNETTKRVATIIRSMFS